MDFMLDFSAILSIHYLGEENVLFTSFFGFIHLFYRHIICGAQAQMSLFFWFLVTYFSISYQTDTQICLFGTCHSFIAINLVMVYCCTKKTERERKKHTQKNVTMINNNNNNDNAANPFPYTTKINKTKAIHLTK